MAFSPDSTDLAVEDTSNVVRVWDTCDICQNAKLLLQRAAAACARNGRVSPAGLHVAAGRRQLRRLRLRACGVLAMFVLCQA